MKSTYSKLYGVTVLIVLISISLLSGCVSNSGSEYNFDNVNIELDQITFEGFDGVYRGKIWIVMELKIDYNDNLLDCTLDDLSYTLEGNGHYLSGGKIEYFGSGENQYKEVKMGTMLYDYLTIYEDASSPYQPMIPTVNINEEIQSALENETTIKWSISGEITLKTPDNEHISYSFDDLTYYQSSFD